MAVNDILNQLQLLIKGAAPELIELSEPPKELIPFVPGERYTAKVQQEISQGRFLVVIQDQKLDLNLPRSTQAGQNIELRFVSSDPRLTFVLAESPTPTAATSAGVNLSDSARYLNALLDKVKTIATEVNAAPERFATAQKVERPILANAATSVADLALALKQTISQSGLFYEAHQAQWVAGERPLQELLREPQGKLAEPRALLAAQTPNANLASGLPANVKPDALPSDMGLLKSAIHQNGEPVHLQTAPIIQQQLDVLDTRQVIWQGQVWAGQEMRWQIEERPAHDDKEVGAREWQTQLDLNLPNLGELNAVLKISPQGTISIALRAHSEHAANTLEAAGGKLSAAMEGAGLQMTQLWVSRDGPV